MIGRLGQIARFIRGVTFKPDDVVPKGTEGSVLCMRTKNVQTVLDTTDVWAIPAELVKREDQFLQQGDLLISSANSWNLVGKACWVPALHAAASFGGFVTVLRADNSIVDSRYLYYWFTSDRTQASLRSFGQKTTNISNLNIRRCEAMEVPLPPMEEQRRIAAILDQAEELRAQRRAAIALLDQLPQAIFLEMFGDPATNPRGLVERTLGSLCDVGSSARVFVEDLVEQGVPFYRGTEIGALGEDKAVVPTLFITHEHFAQLKLRSGTPVPGDLLLPSICPDGRIHRVLNDEPFYFKDGRVLWIKSGGSNVDPIYLRFYLKFLFATEYARIASGTTFAELKIVSLKSAPILLPHIKDQHQFAARVELARRGTAVHQSALAELDALFDSLQYSAFGVQT